MQEPAPQDQSRSRHSSHQRPPVSVIIPHFRQRRFLSRCLSALAHELIPADEVIIIDDASPEPPALDPDWRAMLPCPLRLELRPVNRGAGASRNFGARMASNAFVAFLDADDICLPSRLITQTAAIERGEDVLAAVGDFVIERAGSPEPVLSQHEQSDAGVRDQIRSGYMFAAGSTLMVRRERFLALDGYDETMRIYEDWDLMLRLLQQGTIAHCGVVIARISASGSTPDPVRRAQCLDIIASRHLPALDPPARRALRQAMAYERASLAYRDGRRAAALGWLVRGTIASPPLLLRRLFGRVVRRRT